MLHIRSYIVDNSKKKNGFKFQKENKNKKMFHVKHRKDGEIWLALEDQ